VPRDLTPPLDELFRSLDSSKDGLSTAEATRRLTVYGPNSVKPKQMNPLLRDILSFFSEPLVLILLMAATVSGVLGDPADATIIVAIVLLSGIFNMVQVSRSRLAVSALQKTLSVTATVMRDGKWAEIDREKIVPGDVIRLTAGDLVPADARLIETNVLHVQQSALTGESVPVDKFAQPGAIPSGQPSDNEACVFLGTNVASGIGSALIVNTGGETLFGDIAKRLVQKPPETDFERGLRRFGGLILRTVTFLVLFVFLFSIVAHKDPLESLLFSVALAVGLTPEFLPMITTITLSRGAVHMAHSGVIVKNLASIQNFGSMDILCSDKTGTLTTGELTLNKSVGPSGADDASVSAIASVNSLLQTGLDSTLDGAILTAAGKPEGWTKLGEAPFDFERRRMSVVAQKGDEILLICKGAPESVVAVCKDAVGGALDQTATAKVYQDLSRQGYRLLAVATKSVPKQDNYAPEEEVDMTLVGYLAFSDPPLPDALASLEALRRAGVQVKIISGDNPLVAAHVCTQVGLNPGDLVTGDQLEKLSDTALQAVAEQHTVFARISPAQKNRIILALKARGHVVGYMGDGINDAPSLRNADVGISAFSAVDVAREAADIVLAKPDLMVLRAGVLEGRQAFGNVMKYLLMGTSSNFGNMFSMAGASVVLRFLPMLPTQILLNNFLYDLSQVTIPTDNVDDEYVIKPKKWDIALIRDFMIFIGPLSSIYDFITFWVMLNVFHADEKLFHTGWFVESLATQVLVIFVIRTMRSPWSSRPSPALAWTVVAMVTIGCVLPYLPFASMLGFVPLPPPYFGFLALTVVTYLALVEVVKRKVFGKRGIA
jgi:Mg2+-importing ATPase